MKLTPFVAATICLTALPLIAYADKAGDALLQKCVRAQTALKSLEAQYQRHGTGSQAKQNAKATLRLQKPNRGYIGLSDPETGQVVLSSDGRTLTRYFGQQKVYQTQAVDAQGGNLGGLAFETAAFYNPDVLNRFATQGRGVTVAGTKTVGGTPCQMLAVAGISGATARLYIAPDGTLRGVYTAGGSGTTKGSVESILTNVRVNPTLSASAFAWSKPAGALSVAQYQAQAQKQQAVAKQNEPQVGQTAPDWTLPRPNGGKLRLSDVYRAHKATLVNFWATWCGPCRQELPHLNAMQAELKNRGLAIVAVSANDPPAAVTQFWKQMGLNMTVLVDSGAVQRRYNVSGIPNNWVIGSDGKILGHFVGFDEAGIRGALAKAGVK